MCSDDKVAEIPIRAPTTVPINELHSTTRRVSPGNCNDGMDATASGQPRVPVALADGQVDRPGGARRERDGDDLAALADDHQGAVAAFQAQLLDVSAGSLRHPQPVQGQQGD